MSQSQPAPAEPAFFKSRAWLEPLKPFFYFEPIAISRGRRTAVCTGANYRAFGRALYLSTLAGANLVFELAEASLVAIPPQGLGGGALWDAYFYMAVTMNQSSGTIANAGGECLQGFGIGGMGRNTPWIGQLGPSGGGTIVHVRWNITRQKWELFAASDASDVGVTVDLTTQPLFTTDVHPLEMALEWLPPDTVNVYANGVLVHTQSMAVMLPNAGVFSGSGQQETTLFVTNGSNALFGHVEAGFYLPRFYQPIKYQGVSS